VLSNQPQGHDRTGEAEQRGEGQHGVEPGEESGTGGVGDHLPGLRGDRGEGMNQAARRGGLDELARVGAAGGGSPRQQFGGLVGAAADEDRPPRLGWPAA
jgi:hypothetical protein